jgi:polyketide biosynthesis 3-hydroxy-3-methylglutaryl-CoA synthase-like enzyme PksG
MSKTVGIEAMNLFGGTSYLDVMKLVEHRGLDEARFSNLLMKEKTVVLPFEDPVTFGVNAAKPIIDSLSEKEKESIELVITCTESGIDFAKSISTYIHHYLGLPRKCRLFELKQACYSGTAGFQMAVNFILSQVSPGAKALVIATDIARHIVEKGMQGDRNGEGLTEDWSYAEPSAGAGAVALLVSDQPKVFQVDVGANGIYGYEIMDTCRPTPDSEAGDADLSLLSYLDCYESAFKNYGDVVNNVDYASTFDYLTFHTPFGGMIKGAHRSMMRKIVGAKPLEIEEDFNKRVAPGLKFCQRVGNIMGGTVFMSLASTIYNGNINSTKRVGCFSYGSGCCSEFYSGLVSNRSKEELEPYNIEQRLDGRYSLSPEEYDHLLFTNSELRFGTRNLIVRDDILPQAREVTKKRGELVLKEIKEFHRSYEWIT